MTAAIPASQVVTVNPGVLAPAGTALDTNGLLLTNNTRVPIGSVVSLASQPAVAAYFGALTDEANFATTYFSAYDNSPKKPVALLFSQYPSVAVPAYLRGGPSTLTLAQLQAITPSTVVISVNGVVRTSGTVTLSGATSPSNAASIIQSAFNSFDATGTGVIATTTLTISGSPTGTFAVGQVVTGSGVTAGTVITALGTGTGGAGTYTVSPSQTVSSTTVSAGQLLVTYDSVSSAYVITSGTPGAVSTIAFPTASTVVNQLQLKQSQGAILSQGAAATDPVTAMTAVVGQSVNWATFTTLFKPNITNMLLFASWASGTNNRFGYIAWDTDVNAAAAGSTTTFAYLAQAAGYGNYMAFYQPSGTLTTDAQAGALPMGFFGCLDFARRNGRATLAFKSQTGYMPGVTDLTTATNLIANGYNYYGNYAANAAGFQFFYPGSFAGKFLWADSWINQVKLNSDLQISLTTLLTNTPSIPYSQDGYGAIEEACKDPIRSAVRYGTIRAGVQLSTLQKAELKAYFGTDPVDELQNVGWYLSVLDPGSTVRLARGSPICTLAYVDGQSVQLITIASIDVQ